MSGDLFCCKQALGCKVVNLRFRMAMMPEQIE